MGAWEQKQRGNTTADAVGTQSQSTVERPLPITVKSNSPAPLPLRETFSVVQLMCSRVPCGIRLGPDAARDHFFAWFHFLPYSASLPLLVCSKSPPLINDLHTILITGSASREPDLVGQYPNQAGDWISGLTSGKQAVAVIHLSCTNLKGPPGVRNQCPAEVQWPDCSLWTSGLCSLSDPAPPCSL